MASGAKHSLLQAVNLITEVLDGLVGDDVSSLYRGTGVVGRCDSPRSTRSAPWSAPHARGLYTGSSPRSLRSAGHSHSRALAARRSSSVESHSSNDSRSCKKHRHHRSRRSSDNESELSRCSGGGKSRRHRHRSRRASGGEDTSGRHSSKSSKHRYELVDSESQWKEVQRRQAEGSSGIQQATVVSNKESHNVNRRSGYMNSGMETESEHSYHHRRKHRKHRSRSRSPSEGKSRLPEELKQHLEFRLVETEGMSESQLREIPYKVVETNTAAKAVRVRLSPTRRAHSTRRGKSSVKEDPPNTGDSPPPPYSESPALADILNKNTPASAPSTTPAGSAPQLPRLPPGQTRMSSSATTRSLCSALYGNPATLLGNNPHLPPSGAGHNGGASPHRRDSVDNSAWLGKEYNHSPGKSSSSSLIGISERRKNDLLPRPFPFNSMRSQNSSYSSNHGKQWTTPEVRGTVGLPWPTIVDGLYHSPSPSHPSTPHSSHPHLTDNVGRYPSPPNLNSSHEFLQHVQAATSYINYGTPLHRPHQMNGNVSYDHSSRRYDHNSIHSSVSSELGREQSSSSSSSLRNRSNLSIDKTSLYQTNNRVEKRNEETANSPNHNQSEEKKMETRDWTENERGLLYYQQSEHQNTNSQNGVGNEVNNNPRILHEMSTEL